MLNPTPFRLSLGGWLSIHKASFPPAIRIKSQICGQDLEDLNHGMGELDRSISGNTTLLSSTVVDLASKPLQWPRAVVVYL